MNRTVLGRQYAGPADAAAVPDARSMPDWRAVARRWVLAGCERALGECFVPNARTGVALLAAIAGALTVIAVTLSAGNALLVLLAAVVMRIACERRG